MAAVAAVLVGRRFLDQARMRERLAAIQSDLFFLLAVEEEHCKHHGQKTTVRKAVRQKGFIWSGKFTPGRTRIEVPERASL